MTLSPLRVAPGGRYFETYNLEPFLFIGPNDAITWPGLSGLFRRKDVESTRRYLHDLSEHGINTLRLMLEYSHVDSRNFERRVGTWNPYLLRYWDDLFDLCDEFGLRVLLAPWDNYWMARRWHKHPYNVHNGGPAHSPQAFFTDEATIAAVERRLRYAAARWGGRASFGAWDLFNEIHPHWGGDVAQQSAVIARWSHAIREEECRHWGFTRPQTVSIFGPDPAEYNGLIFEHPSLDFSSTHIYNKGDIDFPRNTVAPALSMQQWTKFGLEHTPQNRPFTDSEHGPIHLFNDHKEYLPEVFDDEYERHLMWAHLASGGAGSGMRWPARHPHILTAGMKRALRNFSAFVGNSLNWRHFTPRDATSDVTVGAKQVHIFAVRDNQQALFWLLRGVPKTHKGIMPPRDPFHDVTVTLHGLNPGPYTLTLWNTRDADQVQQLQADTHHNGTLEFEIAELQEDMTVAVRPK